MNNYSKIGVIVMLLWTTTFIYAQQRPNREKIKTLKVAFITERLDLTTDEAQRFWPVYNAHEDGLQTLKRKERREIRGKFVDSESLSDAEVDALLGQFVSLEKEKHQLQIAFIEEMSGVISSRKTFMLFKAEEDFRRRLLREMQQRRKNGGGY